MHIEIKTITESPGEIVARIRNRRGLTLHQLGELARIPFSYVWAIESGNRRPGPRVAARLADALNMTKADKDAFLLLVAQNGKRQQTTEKSRDIPQSLLLMLAECLAPYLEGKVVKSCSIPNGPSDHSADFIIEFTDGTELVGNMKLRTNR